MREEAIAKAQRECERFLDRIKDLRGLEKVRHEHAEYRLHSGEVVPAFTSVFSIGEAKASGALRRASLDLTRALADMRKP